MEHHVTVRFSDDQEYGFRVPDADTAGLTCMTLLVDKLLRIAITYGERPFANHTAWAKQFARCAGRALGKINITVDVSNLVVAL
jgi:hypothetical protein